MEYLIQISLSWFCFSLLYHFLLRQETFFKLNRWYLIATLLIGLVIPMGAGAFVRLFFPAISPYYLQTITIGIQGFSEQIAFNTEMSSGFFIWNWEVYLKGIYWAGVCLMSGRFIYGLNQILRLKKQTKSIQINNHSVVISPNIQLPFSFFNTIFLQATDDVSTHETKQILQHEQAHIQQKHSYDVILIEILCILFWWNPMIWYYKHALREVHEFLADAAVLQRFNRKQYGQLLIKQSFATAPIALGNHFTQSQLKNRIMMMMKSKSNTLQLLKYLLSFPLFCLLLLSFSAKNVHAQQTNKQLDKSDKVYEEADEMPYFLGCENIKSVAEKKQCSDKKMFQYLFSNLKYPKEAQKEDAEGTVIVQFVVSKEGATENIEIVQSVHPLIDAEVLRIMKEINIWEPAIKDGKPVAVEMKLPVKFKLEGAKTTEQAASQENSLAIRNFRAYPNPASDKIDLSFCIDTESYTIRLTDIDGKEIYAQRKAGFTSCEQTFENISLQQAAKGTLIVSIMDDAGKVFSEKIIVQ